MLVLSVLSVRLPVPVFYGWRGEARRGVACRPPTTRRLALGWASPWSNRRARVPISTPAQAFSVFITIWSLVFDDLRVLVAPKSADSTLVRRRGLASIP